MSPLPALPALPAALSAGVGPSAVPADGLSPLGAFADALSRSSAQLAQSTAAEPAAPSLPASGTDMAIDPTVDAAATSGTDASASSTGSEMISEPTLPQDLTSMASWLAQWSPPTEAEPASPRTAMPRAATTAASAGEARVPVSADLAAGVPAPHAATAVTSPTGTPPRGAMPSRTDLRAEARLRGAADKPGTVDIGEEAETAWAARPIAEEQRAPEAVAAAVDTTSGLPVAQPAAAVPPPAPQATPPLVPAAPFTAGRGADTLVDARVGLADDLPPSPSGFARPAPAASARQRAAVPADEVSGPRAEPATAWPRSETLAMNAVMSTGSDDPRRGIHGNEPAFSQVFDAAMMAQGPSTPASAAAGAGHTGASAPVVPLDTPVLAPEFREALGVQVSVLARDGVQQAELHLNPAEMGPISVRIELDGQQAQVNFGVDNATTRALVEAGMPELASALREAGLTLSGGGVSEHARGQSGETGSAPRDGDRPPGHPGQGRGGGGLVEAADPSPPRPRTLRLAGGLDVYA